MFTLALSVFGLLFYSSAAYAYLDPGSGSYIIQIIVAFFVSGAFALKMFWRRIYFGIANIFRKKGPHN